MTDSLITNSAPPEGEAGVDYCEFLEVCGLFAHLCQSRNKVYRQAFCLDDFTGCERRKLRRRGIEMPDDLLPHGYRLQPDGSAYPSIDPKLPCNTRPVEIGLGVYWVAVLVLVVISSMVG